MRTPTLLLTGALAALLASPTPARAQDQCDASRDISTAVQSSAIVFVEARAGSLRVIGRPDISNVQIRGTACASDADLLSEIAVRTDVDGSGTHVEVVTPDGFGWRNRYARLDLVVEIPAASRLDVVDGSGAIEISGVRGGLVVDDGSGELVIRDVGGGVRLADGSGEISLDGIDGDVVIEEDGSGQIDIREVSGSVTIQEDGSGGIDVRQVSGNLTLERDGSGGVDYRGIGGTVSVPRRR